MTKHDVAAALLCDNQAHLPDETICPDEAAHGARFMQSRRELLTLGAAACAAGLMLQPDELMAASAKARSISLFNLHTGERLRTEYWARGRYNRDALRAVNRIMRDHRTNQVFPIDVRLVEVLNIISRATGSRNGFQVVSGFRSPWSNAMLRASSSGVARNSYHTKGMAIDIRSADIPLRLLHRAATGLRAGGVGFYGRSNFIHVDVGPVRRW